MPSTAICERLKLKKLPQALVVYLFCSPTLDGVFRCLPREGGYLDQDNVDVLNFRIIEGRVFEHVRREFEKRKRIGPKGPKGPVKSVVVAEKDL